MSAFRDKAENICSQGGGEYSTLPGRAGTSNAFSQLTIAGPSLLIWNKRRHLEFGALADRSFRVQTQLILVQTLVREV